MRILLAVMLALMALPAAAQEIVPWDDPRAAEIWPEHLGLVGKTGSPLKIISFQNQFYEIQIVHGWAACGRNSCPAKFIEDGFVVYQDSVCSNSDTYRLRDRWFHHCGDELYLPPGD